MKKVLAIPPKPTNDEEIRIKRFFYLPGWQFDTLIEKRSTIILQELLPGKNMNLNMQAFMD